LRVSGFRVAGTALHHKLCHVLGGSFDLPHAECTRSCCRT
jgi:alcohol dehydrogenase class IV